MSRSRPGSPPALPSSSDLRSSWPLICLPWIIAQGRAWPWEPSTIELQADVYAVRDMLAGGDIYATTTPGWNLALRLPADRRRPDGAAGRRPYVSWHWSWTGLLIWGSSRC